MIFLLTERPLSVASTEETSSYLLSLCASLGRSCDGIGVYPRVEE
jgi:hypothetical protein